MRGLRNESLPIFKIAGRLLNEILVAVTKALVGMVLILHSRSGPVELAHNNEHIVSHDTLPISFHVLKKVNRGSARV